ncbi:MAG: hypothetical protein J7577_20305 [Sphingobacteriaceae bacterium]|nr:hypothetical protein [Sphingobacteriaceae bacterium]
MKKILIWGLSILGIGIFLYVAYIIWVISVFTGAFDSHYSKQDLVRNFRSKTKEIYELKAYAELVIPKDKSVTIEFQDDNELFIFHLSDEKGRSYNWNIKVNSKKADSLLAELRWTKQTLTQLKEKMDNANCVFVENGEPFTVGYQRSGMGMYLYNLFDKPLTDSLKNIYDDGCAHILYNEKVALEFSGGAVGQQCFDGYSKN